LAVTKCVSVEPPGQCSQQGVPPVGNRSVMEVRRPEDNGGNEQAINAWRASPYAPAQEVLQDAAEKQLLRHGNGQVNAKELERKLPERGAGKVRVNEVQRYAQGNAEYGESEEIGEAVQRSCLLHNSL